ncbi:MAG: hypothetical protein ABI587_17160 [Gemmatimonadales bacterium]
MTWRALAVAGPIVCAGGIACGGYDSDGPSGPPSKSTVTVVDDNFLPLVDTVKVGDKITWMWSSAGADNHNIISAGAPSFPNHGTPVTTVGAGVLGVDYFGSPPAHSYQYAFGTGAATTSSAHCTVRRGTACTARSTCCRSGIEL